MWVWPGLTAGHTSIVAKDERRNEDPADEVVDDVIETMTAKGKQDTPVSDSEAPPPG
jgi:hypothetical protein